MIEQPPHLYYFWREAIASGIGIALVYAMSPRLRKALRRLMKGDSF